ncbi:MAG: TIGR01777 family protein [Candidatus Hydrogenedens sp.]|nr:TIGR01777 family protein [Candidatus Hydrogenedentota bacterium]NLF57112.1 TIGR01777 family protein [Candidatus Hydrogenedens sp.]
MLIAVTGATGLIGSTLLPRLTEAGHKVRRLARTASPDGADADQLSYWNPAKGVLDKDALKGVDAVIHLAGESVAARRWTAPVKARIHDSRTHGTALLAQRMADMDRPPKVFVSASAVGYYGSRGGTPLTEQNGAGEGFLARVCRDWEAAATPAAEAGVRVVHPRIGMVLDPEGGALAKMLPPFRMGLGGVIGDGRAWMSWISLPDLVEVLLALAVQDRFTGPVNATAPEPVTNQDFTKTLAAVLRRPAFLPVPAPAVRLLFGEMGGALLLSSLRVLPEKLGNAGHRFGHATLEPALRDLLG